MSCATGAVVKPRDHGGQASRIGVHQHGSMDEQRASRPLRCMPLRSSSDLACTNQHVEATVAKSLRRTSDACSHAESSKRGNEGCTDEFEPLLQGRARRAPRSDQANIHDAGNQRDGSATGRSHAHRPTLSGSTTHRLSKLRQIAIRLRNDERGFALPQNRQMHSVHRCALRQQALFQRKLCGGAYHGRRHSDIPHGMPRGRRRPHFDAQSSDPHTRRACLLCARRCEPRPDRSRPRLQQ